MDEKKPHWAGKHYAFFQNRDCEYFPCHKGVPEADFNCLFCYCPLYTLGADCGGNFYFNEKGMKVCTNCPFPHFRDNFGRITGRYAELAALAGQRRD